jgi:uncharacterized protein YggE
LSPHGARQWQGGVPIRTSKWSLNYIAARPGRAQTEEITMLQHFRSLAGLLIAALICCPLTIARAADDSAADTQEHVIRVSGQGEIEMTPDIGVVTLSIETQAEAAADAQAQAAERMQAVIKALRALNVPENKIRTTNISISPVYPPPPKDARMTTPLKPIGYRSSNSVRVEVSDPARIGPVIDRSLEAGANQVSHIAFDVADDQTPRMKALARAAANAQEKARSIADALDLKLGPVLSVVEGGVSMPPIPKYRGMALAEAGAPTPLMPGTMTVTASVTVEYSLAPK